MPDKVVFDASNFNNKPNVYFLLPDALPAERSLNNIFKNNLKYEYLNKLENYGFLISKNSKSNALLSYPSVPHFFSMDYIFNSVGKVQTKTHVELKTIFTGFNPVIAEFRKRKYKFIKVDGGGHGIGCTGYEDICIKSDKNILNHQDLFFLERSYILRILYRVSKYEQFSKILNFLKINPNNTVGESNNFMHNVPDFQFTDSIIVNDSIDLILPEVSEGPYFFFWWQPFPHMPIRFNRDCSVMPRDDWPNAYEDTFVKWSKTYTNQVKCADKIIYSFAKKIVEKDPNSIVIIHSDHAFDHDLIKSSRLPMRKASMSSIENMISTFAAYKIPDNCKKYLENQNMSPVNSFTLIFACLDKKEPLFKEFKSFVMDYEQKNILKVIKRDDLNK
ncbi:hypothetical protein N9V16_01905 [SAR116 cluster bacterium]|nr:hypothetical protein [SAR116 cluster bacterium]